MSDDKPASDFSFACHVVFFCGVALGLLIGLAVFCYVTQTPYKP